MKASGNYILWDFRQEKYISLSDIKACEARRKSVEKAMATMLSATEDLDEVFLTVLDSYIWGEITLEEMEERINHFDYL